MAVVRPEDDLVGRTRKLTGKKAMWSPPASSCEGLTTNRIMILSRIASRTVNHQGGSAKSSVARLPTSEGADGGKVAAKLSARVVSAYQSRSALSAGGAMRLMARAVHHEPSGYVEYFYVKSFRAVALGAAIRLCEAGARLNSRPTKKQLNGGVE